MTDNGKLLFDLLHGKTLSALANEMGISISNLSRVLNGKGCSKAMANKLNEFFKITNGGFVEEKRDYSSERKPKQIESKPKQIDSKIKKPTFEIGDFVLYTNGKVGQIRKIIYDNYNKTFIYKVRLVEWCRPKEYIDHHKQYNVLDTFNQNQITYIKKEDILKYKNKYFEKLKEKKNNDNKSTHKAIIDSMIAGVTPFDASDVQKKRVEDLIKSWTETELQKASDFTPDEKIMILKQIVYKLLTII